MPARLLRATGVLGTTLLLAGCVGTIAVTSDLTKPTAPSAVKGSPSQGDTSKPSPQASKGASTAPSHTAPASPASDASAKPGPVGNLGTAPACSLDKPAAMTTVGNLRHGAYDAQVLPAGWDALASEVAITEAIKKLDGGPDWACFQKFYAGAFHVYKSRQLAVDPLPPLPSAGCAVESLAAPPVTGLAKHGAYDGLLLPNGWDNLADEAAVTAGIGKMELGPDWACIQKFYPAMVTVYQNKKGAALGATPPPCALATPAAEPVTGLAKHGAYRDHRLPIGWDGLPDEAAITEAIKKLEGGPDWACFQKFYAGAYTIYLARK